MSWKVISLYLVIIVLIWSAWPFLLVYLPNPWPEVAWNLKLGAFGDSFGALNALFSGLAFAGVLAALVLQGKALEQQHIELLNSRLQFSQTVRLSALEMMLSECSRELMNIDELVRTNRYDPKSDNSKRNAFLEKRELLVAEIEAVLSSDAGFVGGTFASKYRNILSKFLHEE